MKTRITGTGSYLPERIMTNRDIERLVETTESWIVERTGIRERRIADEDEAASDLAVHAARRALEMARVDAKDLDLIIVATATPDMFFPSTACIVQDRIGARRAAAFDLSAACSGFLFALSVADQYIRNGVYRNVLIIGSEVMSRIIDWTDRNTCVLFGDGAGAAVLQRTKGEHGVLSTHLHSDGRLWNLIQVPGGGSRIPPSSSMLTERKPFIKMKGNETFKVAVRTLEEAVHETLKAAHVQPSDLSLLIPHQANFRIIKAVAERLGLPMEKVMINVERYGNTSAASIPIALDEAVRQGRVKDGDLLLFEAFGAGLTWASALVRW
ncbi:MAG: beta-ketoacyl-ACP synthase III [Nitrospirota bacterium]